MKQCPNCKQTYADDDLNFCLNDGALLVSILDPSFEETVISSVPLVNQLPPIIKQGVNPIFAYLTIGLLALISGGGIILLLRPNEPSTSNSPTKAESFIPISAQSNLNETTKPITSQNDKIVDNSKFQTPAVAQPTSEYEIRKIRAGIADGKRLRVVFDLARTSLSQGNPLHYEILEQGRANSETRILILAQSNASLTVNFESKRARSLGSILLSPSSQGIEMRIVPQNRLYFREAFFIPRSSANLNDRLVIDLCLEENCPSLNN